MQPLAQTRLENEYNNVLQAIDDGVIQNVSVDLPIKNNAKDYFTWDCVIYGREGTCWENGEFQGQLIFSKDYPKAVPLYRWVKKHENFYHCNIYSDGKTCIDILNSAYRPTTNCIEILRGLEELLYKPNPDSPTNSSIATLYKNKPQEYEKQVREFVVRYMK